MKLKLYIIDDSSVYRKILQYVVKKMDDVELVGVSGCFTKDIESFKETKPDLVLLDVIMPDINGLDALKIIKEFNPKICVLMISGTTKENISMTFDAISRGALDFISKPNLPTFSENAEILTKNILDGIHKFKSKQAPQASSPTPIIPRRTSPALTNSAKQDFEILLIGVSTGGPNALRDILPLFPANFPLPILIVQHMPPHFTNSLAKTLDNSSPLNVMEVTHNEKIIPGKIYLAQGGFHMTVNLNTAGEKILRINEDEKVNECRPSVNVLFNSAFNIYSGKAIVAILTGMGSDGANATKKLKQEGAYVLTQSKDTCVVYGMPRAVDEAGLSDESLPLLEIPQRIQELCNNVQRSRI